MKGIDVSYSQKSIDWLRAAADGVQCVIIRAGYGDDPAQQDAMFAEHITGAIRAGLPVAVFWMAYPVSEDDARAEWAACRQVIAEYKDKVRFVAYDYEGASREYYAKIKGNYPDRDICSAMVDAFLRAEEADGFKPVLYINNDFRRNYITAEVVASSYLWLADNNSEPEVPCAIQQTGPTGPIDGAVGNIDHDVVFDDSLFVDPEAPAQPAEDTYTVVRDVPSYYTAADAAANVNARGTVHPGTYSVFNRAKGVVNVTTTAGQPGSWINPADNTADVEPEPEPEAPVPEMRIGATVQYSGRLYADSYGGGAGMTVSGSYTVDNYIPGRACAVHLPGGWAAESDCTVIG